MKSQTASGGSVTVGLVSKKEKIVPQATAEQLRIAEITNTSSEQDSVELHKCVKKIVEFTGRSQDEAAMALHDSNGDVQEAINLLIEQSSDIGGWETSGKKKKEKLPPFELRPKDDTRRSGDERGGRNRGRNPKTIGIGGTGSRGKGRTLGGPRGLNGREGGRSNGPGQRGSRRHAPEGQQNNNEESWTNGNTDYDDQPVNRKENDENSGQPNDTIGNMGNWDDFKADQKNANDWSHRKENSDWADVAGGEGNNRDWKARHRQPPHQSKSGQSTKGGLSTANSRGTNTASTTTRQQSSEQSQQSKSKNETGATQQNMTTAQRVAASRPQPAATTASRTKVRLPPTSKIPQTPVEMPPDHLDLHGGNSLEVSFGVLSFGTSNFEGISSNLPQNHQQTNKVDHNGSNLQNVSGGHLVQSHPTIAASVSQIKSQQPTASSVDVPKSTIPSNVGASPSSATMTVPPGLDKSAVTTSQTHKSISQSTVTVPPAAASNVSSSYHQQSNTSSYPQYSSNYKQQQQQNNNMAYFHNMYTNQSSPSQYSQGNAQYGGAPTNYGTAFTNSASTGYKSKDASSANSSTTVGEQTVSSPSASQYDNKKSSTLQQQAQQAQQAHQQALQSGGMVLQPGHLPGHMHAASYAHMPGHPGVQALYSYYPHPSHVPPQPGTTSHLPTDYQQGQRESSNTSSATTGISSSLLQQQQQQHSYDKFARSQDESSSSAATQGSSTTGSQSTITATATFPHMAPYNIYYGGPMMTQGAFQPMPFVQASYQTTGTASSSTQASKSSSSYGAGQNSYEYQFNHLTNPASDYNKYPNTKMMANSNKYMSATTAAERR